LLTPTAWALSTILVRGNTMLPSASLTMLVPTQDTVPARNWGGPGGGPDKKLLAFLKANHQGERYLLATVNARQAAPIIIYTGEPVMAMGGFMGSDPILTPESIARMLEDRQIRFVMLDGGGGFGGFPRPVADDVRQQALTDWVKENGVRVDPSLWRSPRPTTGPGADPPRTDPSSSGPGDSPNSTGSTASAQQLPGRGGRTGSPQLYDLRPAAGVVTP
ncbi:MAG TPA: hypothetical protein VEL75_17300, partial [Candidatus Methylomirabilis sp.]|nr:hypothetical protein [Candidatus Methylomirabilis sp.]